MTVWNADGSEEMHGQTPVRISEEWRRSSVIQMYGTRAMDRLPWYQSYETFHKQN